MIIQEQKGKLIYTYSDRYMFIEREDGERFASAYDVVPHSYQETEEKIYNEEDLDHMRQIDPETVARIEEAYKD